MKRSALALAAVAAVAVAAPPALAAKKPVAPKPVTKTFYFHGSSASGNQDQQGGALLSMDAVKPTGGSDKSFVSFGAVASPNTECAGNSLFPNWVGNVSGTLKKAKVSFYANSTPASTVKVQVFADVAAQACNEEYPGAIGEVEVPVKAGAGASLVTVDVPISGPAKLISNLTVQLQPGGLPGPQVTQYTYDSSASPASITFTCQPATGKKTC